jgi:quercetin dioxygenase-like cupin family protein
MNTHSITSGSPTPLPADDLSRDLTLARPDEDETLPHIGLVGDTYTVLLSGNNTAGRYCLIDMLVRPGGGPGPHRHDFEETFVLLEGQIEATFRGEKTTVKAGETVHIPANAPHQFHNASDQPARLLCICGPAGQEEFFAQIGVPVATRTMTPPPLNEAAQAAFIQKAQLLARQYRSELLKPGGES